MDAGLATVIGAGITAAGSYGTAEASSHRGYHFTKRLQQNAFDLNEQAADNAYNRALGLYDYQYQKESPAALRKQLEEAGLSVGLMYGGGGASGGATMQQGQQGGTESGNVAGGNSLQLDPALLAQVENIKANTEKTRAEAEQLQKTGEKTEAETAYTEAQTKWLETNAPIDAYRKVQEMAIKAYENEGEAGRDFDYKFNEIEVHVNGKSYTAQKLSNDLAKDMVQIWKDGTEAQKNLAQAAEANQHVQYMIDQITQMAMANQIEWAKVGILNSQLELDWAKFEDLKGQGDRDAKRLELMAQQVAYETGENMNTKNVLSLIFQGIGAVGRAAGAAAVIGAL